MQAGNKGNGSKRGPQAGFSLLETMVSLGVLMGVSAFVMTGMVQMMKTQGTIANRTQMHTSVRSATELLQQEIGQAGRISLADPATSVTMGTVTAGSGKSISLTPNTAKVYVGEILTVDVGLAQESVTVTGTNASPTGSFLKPHPNSTPVAALGAFATGVIPPAAAPASYTDGSTPTVLKLYGDINGDGNMVYVEYTCDTTTNFVLYRNQMPFDAGARTANDNSMILLSNIQPNPKDAGGNVAPCFSYQVEALGASYVVTDVAVTLTEQTQNKDPQTGQYQQETKALLNISPRNVFEVWDTANLGNPERVQPIPATVTTLIHIP